MKSEQINELATALSRTQAQLHPASKNKKNPFFKSDYADLEASWECCRALLAANGLCVIQTTDHAEDGSIELITTLAHASGQWIDGRYPIKAIKQDPQGVGSAITYARRYALQAIVGIVTGDDDDGEHAMGRDKNHKPKPIELTMNGVKTEVAEVKNLPTPALAFRPPEVTPHMKAMFEKNETEEIKKKLEAQIISAPLPFEENYEEEERAGIEEKPYVNGNTLIPWGKNKGKTFAEAGNEALDKAVWGAEKGLSEGAEWVDKIGADKVAQFARLARAYLTNN